MKIMYHLISNKCALRVGEYDDRALADKLSPQFIVMDDDTFEQARLDWAEREGVHVSDILVDVDGDEYVLIENEDGYERKYVEYV